ncbi:MAG TPA: carboxypeptidase regulatory-like domain-containing protein, partial [Polyangiaceae bacterium]
PQIALTTGHSDALECLLRRIGISDQEFTVDSGPGRVHMFVGCDGDSGLPANQFSPALGGAKFAAATSLWADPMKLMKYDMLVMSCEGSQCESDKKPYINNIKMYADNGGRLFLDHLHFYWLRSGPDPWPDTADYVGPNQKDLPSPFTAKVDQTFPKGSQFAEWLVATQASPEAGTIQILGGQFSVRSATPPATQKWIYTDQNPRDPSGTAVEYMTMNTPTPSELPDSGPDSVACGRVVFTDLHVVVANGADGGTGLKDVSHSDTPFPNGCVSGPLTPQEKALEFMFFDLSSCVEKDSETPKAPPLR